MRKIQILGAVFFVMLALGAVVASSAFATEDVWLIGGQKVGATPLSAVTEGKLLIRLLAALGGNVHLLCSDKFVGTVNEKGLDRVTSVVNLAGTSSTINCEVLHSELGLCSGSLLALLKAINLPWHSQLLLLTDQTLFVDDILLETGKTPGYESSCTTSTGGTLKETCEGGFSTDDLVNNTGGVFVTILNALTDKCGINGNVLHIDGEGETKALSGTLSVSAN